LFIRNYSLCCAGISYNAYILTSLGQVKSFFQDNSINLGDNETLTGQLYELVMSLKNYPIVTSLISIWALIVEIEFAAGGFNHTSRRFWMQMSLAILQSSQGTFHVMIYFYRSYRRGKLWSKDEGLCGLCCGCDDGFMESHSTSNSNTTRQLSLANATPQVLNGDGYSTGTNSRNISNNSDTNHTRSKSTPSLLEVERAADTICPIFGDDDSDSLRNNDFVVGSPVDIEAFNVMSGRGYFPPSVEAPMRHSMSNGTHKTYGHADLNSEYNSVMRPSQLTLGPNPASISVRIGEDSDSCNTNSKLSAHSELLTIAARGGHNGDNSFGVCLED
jgi:hypothetical protein